MSFLSNGNAMEMLNQGLKKPFTLERERDNVLKLKIL
jgi:hypothetical protein